MRRKVWAEVRAGAGLTERPAHPGEGSLRARIFMRYLSFLFFGARDDGAVDADGFVRRTAVCRDLIIGVLFEGRRALQTAARARTLPRVGRPLYGSGSQLQACGLL